jgi:outer membrane receptor protein involved in Fe transport
MGRREDIMLKSKQKFNYLLATASVAALVMPFSAAAQETGTSEESETRRLNTVQVTATRREGATIQDVPIAVTAVDAEMLERAGVADIRSLDAVAPSFSMTSSDSESGGTVLRIRGVGTTGNNVGLESAVGVFLDGEYLSRPGIALADLLDVEQIEVLRGPQGTLFGRNTSSGALSIQTKKPDLVEAGGFANLTIGNYDLRNIQGGVNLPIVEDTFAVRLSGAIRERGGFVERFDGQETNTRDRFTLRGQALLDLKEAGEFRLIADFAEGKDECCDAIWLQDAAQRAVFAATPLGAGGGAPNVGDAALDEYRGNGTSFANPFEQWGISLGYENELPFGDLTYLGAYRDYSAQSARDNDFVGLSIFTTGITPEAQAAGVTGPENTIDVKTQSHELRLQNTAFGERLDWLVGLYYSDEDISSRATVTLLSDYQQGLSAGLFGSPNNLLLGFAGGVSADGDFATNAFSQEGESLSIFTHNVFNVTDQFNVTLGLRYVEESKDGSFNQLAGRHNACLSTFQNLGGIPGTLTGNAVALNCFVFTAPVYDPANPGPLFGAIGQSPAAGLLALLPQEFDDTFEDEELIYTLKAGYEITPDINVYGGFTHGFKSGGFNLDASAAGGGADPRFDSEKVDAFEIGLKSVLFDGRATLNVAAFHQEFEDFQVLEFTGIQFQTFNVDKAISTGIEVESQMQFTDSFSGNLGVTYTDARYPNDCATQDATDPNFIRNAATLCGQSLTNAPDWTAIAGATYERPIFDGAADFFATASARYESDRRTSTQAVEVSNPSLLLPGDIQESHTKVNLRVGLKSEGERWAVELWGNNVTDERTKGVTFNVALRGNAGNRARAQFVQDPATYGITLRTKF